MEIRIEKKEVKKMLMKLIPAKVFEGLTITNIETKYDGTIIIDVVEIEEGEKDADL